VLSFNCVEASLSDSFFATARLGSFAIGTYQGIVIQPAPIELAAPPAWLGRMKTPAEADLANAARLIATATRQQLPPAQLAIESRRQSKPASSRRLKGWIANN